MRALGLALAVTLLAIATVASCSLKLPFECADGGCWGEPDYATSDGGTSPPDLPPTND